MAADGPGWRRGAQRCEGRGPDSGGAGVGGGTGPGARGRGASGRRHAAMPPLPGQAREGRRDPGPPGLGEAADSLGAVGMYHTVRAARSAGPSPCQRGTVTNSSELLRSGAVIPPHEGDWDRHVLLQAACCPWGSLSLRKMRLRCGVSSGDR